MPRKKQLSIAWQDKIVRMTDIKTNEPIIISELEIRIYAFTGQNLVVGTKMKL